MERRVSAETEELVARILQEFSVSQGEAEGSGENGEDLEELEKLSLIEELFPRNFSVDSAGYTPPITFGAFLGIKKKRMDFLCSVSDNKKARDSYDIIEKMWIDDLTEIAEKQFKKAQASVRTQWGERDSTGHNNASREGSYWFQVFTCLRGASDYARNKNIGVE